jgi:steroid 5-alpha reductase family enzyme
MAAFLFPAGVLLLYMLTLFAIARIRSDNGTADIGYGIGFIIVVGAALSVRETTLYTGILAALVFVWGVRLATRIYLKNRGKPEDFRYRAWREAWGPFFLIRSLFQIYLLQGAVIFTVSLPVLLAILFPREPFTPLVGIGVAIWSIGFMFEAVGDAQLDRFIANPLNKGNILTTGLWRYSRHPNYFGESLMWWGICIASVGLTTLPLLGLVSPLLITFLLLKVSGIPMLEKKWEGNPQWEAYKARTSAFIPLPPRA